MNFFNDVASLIGLVLLLICLNVVFFIKYLLWLIHYFINVEFDFLQYTQRVAEFYIVHLIAHYDC